jgi:hypothetical protein
MQVDNLRTHTVYGVRIFHAEIGDFRGLTCLPKNCVALHGEACAIIGEPSNEVKQWAFSEAAFERLYLIVSPSAEASRTVAKLLTAYVRLAPC